MKNIKVLFSWVAVAVWMLLIFSFSAQNGETSGNLSNRFMSSLLIPIFNFLGVTIQDLNSWGLLIRKAAHMFIYFVLAILSVHALFVSNFFKNKVYNYGTALVISFLYACSDEWHQSFTPGRTMAFADVLIDTAGAILGLILFFLIKTFFPTSYFTAK